MKKISELTPISGEIQEEDILVVNTAGGTRKITYAELCEAVKITLGIREVVESVNITEPGFLMDGQTASEALAQLNGNIEQLNSQTQTISSKVFVDGKPNVTGGQFSGIVKPLECWLVCGMNYIQNEVVLALVYRSDVSSNTRKVYLYQSNDKISISTNSSGTVSIRYEDQVTNDVKGAMFRLI